MRLAKRPAITLIELSECFRDSAIKSLEKVQQRLAANKGDKALGKRAEELAAEIEAHNTRIAKLNRRQEELS